MYSSISPPASAYLLSFRHVDVLVSFERRVMVDMKQRKRQVGHRLERIVFWFAHSPLVSFILVLALQVHRHVRGCRAFRGGTKTCNVYRYLFLIMRTCRLHHENDAERFGKSAECCKHVLNEREF